MAKWRKGDYVFLQSGHNDERARNDGVDPDGEQIRYGGGSTEEMYRRFPQIMRETGKKLNIPVIDLNAKSVEYFNQIGPIAAKALVMAVEPGETPGKTNSGSYANGNPFNHPDGTHYKEGLNKQYCRMAAEEIYRLKMEGLWIQIDKLYDLLSPKVKKGVKTGDFSQFFPEVCADTERGPGSYYRNQIEKMVRLGVFHKDQKGCFYPWQLCGEGEFYRALKQLWNLPEGFTPWEKDRPLTRKRAAFMLYDGYVLRFGLEEKNKPPYMTDYNDISISPDDPNYDSNIPLGATIYYPLVPFEKLEDMEEITKEEKTKVEAVYRLGLMRSEQHIRRGSLKNGRLFQPDLEVTREKAEKLLYFCFALKQNVKRENHRIDD